MFCPECKQEYREGFSRCANCGIALVAEVLPEPEPELAEFVYLTTMQSFVLAQPLVDFLSTHGVQTHLQSDDCGGVDPALCFIHGVRVFVAKAELEQARQLLAEHEEDIPDENGVS